MKVTVSKEKGLLRLNGITKENIRSLLESKHSKDVFIPECKNGETWGARDLLKLDAWVLLRTYSPLTTIGYEIKCSRQDFEQDQKWTKYLDLCHLFYFVCPAGLIRATDLPSSVGIVWASKNKLHIKHKAERVNPDIEKLNGLLIYALMSRSKIVANMNEIASKIPKDKLVELKEVVEKANEKKELAYFIKGHVRDAFNRIMDIERGIADREADVKMFEEKLAKLGITWDSESHDWMNRTTIENEIDLIGKRIDWRTLNDMKNLANNLINVVAEIEEHRKRCSQEIIG